MEPLALIALAVIVIVALPFVLGPFLVRRNVRQKARPELQALDTESGELPAEVYQHFLRTVEVLKEDGFRVCGYYRQAGQATRVTLYLALFKNDAQHDLGLGAAMYAAVKGQSSLRTSFVAFSTHFRDGLQVNTGNTAQLGVHAEVPTRKGKTFPDVTDPRRLYRIHRALCSRWGRAETEPLPADAELPARVAQNMAGELQDQAAAGYYYLDSAGGCFRPTWKGAFLMTWKLCWPVTSIRKALRASRNAVLLRELGV